MNLVPFAIAAVVYYLWTTTTPPLKPGEKSFTLYYWNKCGHCTRMMPDFNKLGSSVGGVKIRKVEASQNNEKEVRGFPTMVFRDGEGGEEIYTGGRSHKEIRDYILSMTK